MSVRRPTSFDIAALAGVSQATVSRALSQSASVSEAVRQRVFEAAQKLNYTVDVNARKLRSKKINTIAVLISEDLDQDNPINPFFVPLIGSILKYAAQKGYDVLVSLQQQSDDWGGDYGFARRADGIIFLGYNDYEAYSRKVGALSDIGEPWVVWGPVQADNPNLFIGSDNENGAYEAVSHLIGLGRRRIAFLGETSGEHPEFRDRYNGYVRALTEAGIAVDPALLSDCFISREDGAAAIGRLMETGVDFDAVFATADLTAIGAMQALLKAGRRVPEDVSVMGFDDLWAASCTTPALSTVRQDTTLAARVLVDALDQLIAEQPVSVTRVPTRLMIRESCGG
ncbi:MAG: LacI family DNA-binding transcriptional regulator [Asticcacaulis sp.]